MKRLCMFLFLLGVLSNPVLSNAFLAQHDGGLSKQLLSQSWLQDNNQPITIDSLSSGLVVASLFYTNCPNTCNFTIQRFKQLEEKFATMDIAVEFVQMSLDPKNDTPEVLSRYRQDRELTSPKWHFLSSTEQQVADIARGLGYKFTRLDDHVFHRMKIFILTPDGGIIKTITMKTNIDDLVFDNDGKSYE